MNNSIFFGLIIMFVLVLVINAKFTSIKDDSLTAQSNLKLLAKEISTLSEAEILLKLENATPEQQQNLCCIFCLCPCCNSGLFKQLCGCPH